MVWMNDDNMQLSPELQQELADIRNIISQKYRQFLQHVDSSHGSENNDAANLYSNAVDVLEPPVLFDKYMNANQGFNKDDLEQYTGLLRNAMSDLSIIYNNLENMGAADKSLFGDMNLLDNKIDKFYGRLQNGFGQNPQREMGAADVVQSAADDKRKLETELQQQDKVKDKQGIKKENIFAKDIKFTNRYHENTVGRKKTNALILAEFQRIDKMFDRTHPAESFKKMMYAVRDANRNGLINKEQLEVYKNIFNQVKEHKNWERGIFDLSTELNIHMSEMRDADKAKVKGHDKSSKFKDGVLKVLNKQRDEKSQTKNKDDKEKQDAFVEMLRRKKMKGLVE